MKISVITATWNSEKTIADTIESFKQQDYENTEYIIVDGGSSDATLEIIDANKDCIDHIISEKDQGIYDALNKGISLATGNVVGFLHSDDLFANKSVLRKIAEKFVNEKVDCVYGDLNYVSRNNINNVIRRWVSGNYERKKILNGWMPPHPTFYLKRDSYNKFGAFDLSFKIAADYDSILRYLWSERLVAGYIPEVLVNMRLGGESNKSLENILQKSKEDCRAMRRNHIPILRAFLGKNISKIPQFFVR